MRTILAAAFALAALPAAAGGLVWSGGAEWNNAALKLSEPGTENIPLEFWCEKDVGVVNVAYKFMPANPKEGMEAAFVLKAGGVELPVQALGYNIEIDRSFVLEGQIDFDARFVALLSATGPLTVTAEGRTETFSLDGATAAIGPLVEMCGR